MASNGSKNSATGAQLIAKALHELGVKVIFGIVGIPVVEIAEEAINLGIKFVGFRNEQAAGYAATAYGYLTGRPGVCLVVGGPGVLHAMAGIGNATANAFPLLLLAGSSESHLTSKGAFQELDAISLLSPHTKLALRPSSLPAISESIEATYRSSFYGRPGTTFIDLPADLIQGAITSSEVPRPLQPVPSLPDLTPIIQRLKNIATVLKTAQAPLIVIGKGCAYAKAETPIRNLVDKAKIPFLPTPMGKGVVPDSHPLNTASARSTALKEADVVLILGARLNWILHFGKSPKWNPKARFIQIDIAPEEMGKNGADAELSVVGDVRVAAEQLLSQLGAWSYDTSRSSYVKHIRAAAEKNTVNAAKKAKINKSPMTYARAFDVIKDTLHSISPVEDGGIVYVSEGANTMDISRSVFPVEYPRLRLDAGTYATMGVGLGYAIAAWEAYNSTAKEGEAGPSQKRRAPKKVVCLEGDSAFGFSAMEVETMSRYGMDVLIFVMNNGGVYHGDSDSADDWLKLQSYTVSGENPSQGGKAGLRSTSLGYEVRYEKIAEACGGLGFFCRTPEELEKATREGYGSGKVCVVNVVIESNKGQKLEFGWQASAKKEEKAKL
ncbi:hypothetical protein MMC25_000435 [Agyrium rufum]|nr:hypothetical protein [Agyrium rufum]